MSEIKWNAESIKQLRKDFGLTQLDLCELLGCRQQTISEWEMSRYEPKNAYQKLFTLIRDKLERERPRAVSSANPQ